MSHVTRLTSSSISIWRWPWNSDPPSLPLVLRLQAHITILRLCGEGNQTQGHKHGKTSMLPIEVHSQLLIFYNYSALIDTFSILLWDLLNQIYDFMNYIIFFKFFQLSLFNYMYVCVRIYAHESKCPEMSGEGIRCPELELQAVVRHLIVLGTEHLSHISSPE